MTSPLNSMRPGLQAEMDYRRERIAGYFRHTGGERSHHSRRTHNPVRFRRRHDGE